MKKIFQTYVPDTFSSPEQLPSTEGEGQHWQHANRSFWESNPMRYAWNDAVEFEEFSRPFYEEIDKRFFSTAREYMPWKHIPFDALIDFEKLRSAKILEIGVGMGSHAQLLAAHAGSYTGIDITSHAVKATSERLRLFNLPAEIHRMDAEHMSFPDSSFDFVWSWGVIHHSSDTGQILREIHRVLKPGGEAVIMVYHRGWWNYYICGGFIHGLVLGKLFRTGSLHKTVQNTTDGALARYYTPSSWRNLAHEHFDVKYVVIKGNKAEVFPFPGGRVKNAIIKSVPNVITRFLTNYCRMGSFLISGLVKH